MRKPIEITERCYTPGQAAQLLGVNVFTLRTWARDGKIASVKTVGGHRRIPQWVVDQMLGKQTQRGARLRVAIYARVSTKKQAEMGNLVRQKDRLFEHAISSGYDVVASFS
ncbi:MAG: recombinase family protein [Candidatus Schekmanbacteria bacterium]|nr:recombinase family protein [Candidatus Schekmanbacteria bacterium]